MNLRLVTQSLFTLFLLVGCGIATYPGQPGMVSNNYVKLDLENLEADGLFVYETVYDNRPGGSGVGAIVTKLYPKAQTYTSNVRTNADGTLFRTKAQYDGAEVQMISLPSVQQIHLSPGNKIAMLIDYNVSLDEIDEKNIAEQSIFKPMEAALSPRATEYKKMRWDLLRAGNLSPNGNLAYEITALELGQVKFAPAKPVKVETTFFQNAIHSDVTPETKTEFVKFLEANFPKGFKGKLNVHVKGTEQPIAIQIGLNTVKTAEANGYTVAMDASEAMVQEVLNRFKNRK